MACGRRTPVSRLLGDAMHDGAKAVDRRCARTGANYTRRESGDQDGKI